MIWTSAGLLTILATTLLCAQPSSAQDEDGTLNENTDILQDLGADLRIAVFAGVMPSDEAYSIWESAEQALTAEKPEAQDMPDNDIGDREAMAIYSNALKDAVANGEMTGEESAQAWEQAMVDVKTFYAEHERNNPGTKLPPGSWHRSMRQEGRMLITRLRTPNPGRIHILLRPEFHRRDTAYLQSELELDPSITTIIETMVENYNDLYAEKADTFRTSLFQSRRRGSLDKVDGVLARMQNIRVDRDRAAERIGVIQNAEKRQFMFDKLDNFEENLGNLRGALIDRRETILADGDVPDRSSIHRMFKEFETFRTKQYDNIADGVEAILPQEQSSELAALLDQLSLEQARIDATMGGMDTNLVLALQEAMPETEPDAETIALLGNSIDRMAATADEWTKQTIRREGRGLELDTAKIQGDDARIDMASQAYTSALGSELTAIINLRNETQNAISEISEHLMTGNSSVAQRFLASARQQGFRAQMRQRWCQRALALALEMEDLEEDIVLELIAIQEDIAPQIDVMREQAIQQRLQQEPRIARDCIERLRNPDASGLDMLAFQEPNHLEFQRLDEQVERQLLALMGEERFRALPRRPGTRPEKKAQSKDAKGGSKGGSKGGGKGEGNGSGKGTSDDSKGTSRGVRGRGKGGGKG